MTRDVGRELAKALGMVECDKWLATGGPFWGWSKANCGHTNCYPKELPPDFLSPVVFWPEFEKWCEGQDLHWEVGSDSRHYDDSGVFDGVCRPCKYAKILSDGFDELFREEGATSTEAGCLAWLAALNSLKERSGK